MSASLDSWPVCSRYCSSAFLGTGYSCSEYEYPWDSSVGALTPRLLATCTHR